MTIDLSSHYDEVVAELVEGRVIPFLGAAVNTIDRSEGIEWNFGASYLPRGKELARYLANKHGYPDEDSDNLLRVSQYVAVATGTGPLYDDLHRVFAADYAPTPLHEFLARLPAMLAAKGYESDPLLILTTNYDDALENALRTAAEEFDLLTYIAKGKHRGKFWHVPPEGSGEAVVVEVPNIYDGLVPSSRIIVLKIHGAVDRLEESRDSYVITEDHYIAYLTHTELANFVPATIAAKMRSSHFLFLGYSLSDWNLRVMLHRIWADQDLDFQSWAIQRDAGEFEHKYWTKHNVDVLNVPLVEYVRGLSQRLSDWPRAHTINE